MEFEAIEGEDVLSGVVRQVPINIGNGGLPSFAVPLDVGVCWDGYCAWVDWGFGWCLALSDK